VDLSDADCSLLVTDSNTVLYEAKDISVYSSALEVFLNDMRYINPRFTYLLTYLLTPAYGTSS